MPYKIIAKKDGKYKVVSPHGIRAKETTLEKAKVQIRAIYKHGKKD